MYTLINLCWNESTRIVLASWPALKHISLQVLVLEPVSCKKRQKIVPDINNITLFLTSYVLVQTLMSRGPLKDLKDSKLILNESKLFPWSSRISLVPFRTFRGPLFPKPVTGQELFCRFLQQTSSSRWDLRVSPIGWTKYIKIFKMPCRCKTKILVG